MNDVTHDAETVNLIAVDFSDMSSGDMRGLLYKQSDTIAELRAALSAMPPQEVRVKEAALHELWVGNEVEMCNGCGSVETFAAIKARRPNAISCCPERKMVAKILASKEVSVQDAAKVLLDNCPNPIFGDLKYALIGEFKQSVPSVDEGGGEIWYDRVIEWTTTKLIIEAALRALSEKPHG